MVDIRIPQQKIPQFRPIESPVPQGIPGMLTVPRAVPQQARRDADLGINGNTPRFTLAGCGNKNVISTTDPELLQKMATAKGEIYDTRRQGEVRQSYTRLETIERQRVGLEKVARDQAVIYESMKRQREAITARESTVKSVFGGKAPFEER